jgi:glyoxylase-like metal-dependent hydrolase (beta-lactamase superfamily II)
MVVEIVHHANGQILEWKWSTNNALMEKPFWTSAYLLDQILIDCGAPASVAEMDTFLQNLPREQFPIACYLTHAHEDHAGTGHLLVEKYNIPVYGAPESISLLKNGWEYQEYRQLTWGEMGFTGFDALPYKTPIETPSGLKFDILPMPGHSPDLHAFIEKSHGWAFLGDMMLPQYQMLFGYTCEIQEDIKTIADSLEKLYEFTAGIPNLQMFVAGKGVYMGRDLIRSRLDEIYDLHIKVHEASAKLDPDLKPSKRMRKLLLDLFGGESFFGGMTGGELSRANMITSCLKWLL